jgi:hypothetical protein
LAARRSTWRRLVLLYYRFVLFGVTVVVSLICLDDSALRLGCVLLDWIVL